MSDIDKDIKILENLDMDELIDSYIYQDKFSQALENVLAKLKITKIENKDLKEKLVIQGNLTETWKKIAENRGGE